MSWFLLDFSIDANTIPRYFQNPIWRPTISAELTILRSKIASKEIALHFPMVARDSPSEKGILWFIASITFLFAERLTLCHVLARINLIYLFGITLTCASWIFARSSSDGNIFSNLSIPSRVTTVWSIFKIAALIARGGGSFVIAILMALERLWSRTIISLFLFSSCCFCSVWFGKRIQLILHGVYGLYMGIRILFQRQI